MEFQWYFSFIFMCSCPFTEHWREESGSISFTRLYHCRVATTTQPQGCAHSLCLARAAPCQFPLTQVEIKIDSISVIQKVWLQKGLPTPTTRNTDGQWQMEQKAALFHCGSCWQTAGVWVNEVQPQSRTGFSTHSQSTVCAGIDRHESQTGCCWEHLSDQKSE